MDAKELTKRFYDLENKILELIKEVEYLKDENSKMRLKLNDLDIDVHMLTRR